MNQDVNTLIRLACIKYLGDPAGDYEKLNINDLIVLALTKYINAA